jgi:hypothetical protein
VTSHEHRETITDQQGNAWWDINGNEIGDKYNESINGHNYFLQQEWSNRSSKCVQKGA